MRRATEILRSLEQDELQRGGRPSLNGGNARQAQLGLFQTTADALHPLVERLRAIDLDRLTPIDALNLLADLKRNAE